MLLLLFALLFLCLDLLAFVMDSGEGKELQHDAGDNQNNDDEVINFNLVKQFALRS